jgi:hypothetical protein
MVLKRSCEGFAGALYSPGIGAPVARGSLGRTDPHFSLRVNGNLSANGSPTLAQDENRKLRQCPSRVAALA